MNLKERKFYKENLTEVLHTTLNPYEPGVVRIHLIPAKYQPLKVNPSVVILNGKEVTDEELKEVVEKTLDEIQKVYKHPGREILKKDLNRILSVFIDIAEGKVPNEKSGQLSIGKYSKNQKKHLSLKVWEQH